MATPVKSDGFSYKPLDTNDFPIRILQVESGDVSESLCCTLVNYADAIERGWTCLSYTWGTEPPTKEITINGASFPVRLNVYNFLREAQRQGLTNLWIDSMCINQSDTDERNAQVGLMSRIFSEAKLVIVWLGQTSPALERAIKHLDSNFPVDTVTIRAAAAQPVCCQLSPVECSSLFEACGAAIWTRRWVKQEIMLPERVTLFCGQASISISIFFAAMDALVDYGTLHSHTVSVPSPSSSPQADCSVEKQDEPSACFYDQNNFDQLHRQCANVLAFHSATRSKGWQIQLPMLLKMFQDSVCTDFHDHVYAFRGVMEQGTSLPVDYNMSNTNMFLQTLDYVAQTTHPRLRGTSAAERDLLLDLYRGFNLNAEDLEDIFRFCNTTFLLQVGYNFDMLRKDISVWTFLDSITDRDEFITSPWRETRLCRDCSKVLSDQDMDEYHTVLNQLRPGPDLSNRGVWLYGLRCWGGPGLRGLRAVYSPRWLYGCSEDTFQLLQSGIQEDHPLRAMSFETCGKDQELVNWLDEIKNHFVVMVTDRDDAAYQMQIFIMPRCQSEGCLLADKPNYMKL
ncbi:heterokaryon incompatibility -domain-containing [Fusarium sporotrichioides]|uniref:Heterokaryon incompatibility-domain-containing n=1 Tax=Fusarium sporotrichioides TaxID=5514 RepID=A0A395SB84_FUSSP|nr:heterokaryon incompatibility -domain-containing [Fusarium sporotrichioides]